MAIKNPYPLEEHRAFKRTFLQQTEVIMKFAPALTDVDFRLRMFPYLKSVFNLDLTDESETETNHIEINSDIEQKRFVFDVNHVKLIIGPKTYKTFTDTAVPTIGILTRFLKEVANVENLDELNIVKINNWPIKAEDAFSSFTNMIRYTFNERSVSDMLSYKFDANPKPVRLSKASNTIVSEDIELNAVLSAEVQSKEKVDLGLVLTASAKNIDQNDIFSDAITLNDIVYRGFIETISENIIDFMGRENVL